MTVGDHVWTPDGLGVVKNETERPDGRKPGPERWYVRGMVVPNTDDEGR